MSPVNTELSGFTVRAGRGFSGSDSDAGLSSFVDVIGHSVFISHVFFYLCLYILFCTENCLFLFLEGNTSLQCCKESLRSNALVLSLCHCWLIYCQLFV